MSNDLPTVRLHLTLTLFEGEWRWYLDDDDGTQVAAGLGWNYEAALAQALPAVKTAALQDDPFRQPNGAA